MSAGPHRRDVLRVAAGVTALGLAPAAVARAQASAIGFERGQDFDLDWRFYHGAGDLHAPALDDSGWRMVDLPHDWSIEDLPADPTRIRGPFDKAEAAGTDTGFTRGGEGWYRKRFRLADPHPGRVEIRFDGVYMDSDVWLNGHKLGTHRNGYTPFVYDLTPHLAADGDNVIAVHVRNLGHNARWYSGSGIYRHVRLDVLREPARLEPWGTTIVTRRVADGIATLELDSALLDAGAGLTRTARIRETDGRTVWSGDIDGKRTITVPDAKLWSPDRPHLYTATIELRRGATLLDTLDIPFGIRIVTFDAAKGMTVNGVPTKLRGGCIHHDHGILGAASFDDAEWRKVALMKARGYNAVRPSHVPFAPAFLRACDAQGLMVVYELFDLWREPKTPDDFSRFFAEDWQADLDASVRSARHHPSIVMWSIGNEIPGRDRTEGRELQWQLTQAVHRLDPSRPVTAAIHGFAGHDATVDGRTDRTSTAFLDLVGYNYKLADYDSDHARFPQRVFFGSESFPKDVVAIWDKVERAPWLIGDFVWTAMDYLGEAGIGGSVIGPAKNQGPPPAAAWPWVNAFCGDIDLIGDAKAASHARDVVWGVSALEIAVQRPAPEGMAEKLRFWGWPDERQSWTWPDAPGQPLIVRAYTKGDRVDLLLNGRQVATRSLGPDDNQRSGFTLPYAPGTLQAVAYRGGREIGRRQLQTAGMAAAVRLRSERPGGATRGDLTYVGVEIVDAQGRVVPDAAAELTVTVGGVGTLIGFGSADPHAPGSYQAGTARAWRGRALAVVRATGGAGRVLVTATGGGLRGKTMFRIG